MTADHIRTSSVQVRVGLSLGCVHINTSTVRVRFSLVRAFLRRSCF